MADPRTWIEGDESAAEMLARLETERPALLIPPLHRIHIRAGNVVEITGSSQSAKTEILLQAAIHCILPKEWNGVHFGGLERLVAYFDLDCRFDVLRLSQALKHRIMRVYEEELFVSCMRRFLYIRCYNTFEFLAALKTMHFQFLEASEQIGVSIHILMIDSIGAFYWMNRAYLSLPTDDKTRKEISLENLSKTVVEEINNIRNVQPLLVLATKVAIFGVADPKIDVQRVVVKGHSEGSGNVEDRKITGNLLYREYMPLVWQSFVTHKVHLGISDVVASDERNGASPTYICKWIQPPVNMFDRYVVTNDGIFMVS